MPVRIVTDSACDLTIDETEDLQVGVVPLTIRIDGTEYVDRTELSVDDFYAKMASASGLPETAAPSPGAFEEAFRAAQSEGADAVVCINLSSELSATMASAQNAARALDGLDVRVFDSLSLSGGLGTMVTLAARAARDGAGADEIVTELEQLRARTRVYASLDTLDNLKKGGRIGGAQAFIGGMLQIKPVINVSAGHVEEAGKARTRKKSMLWLRDQLAKEGEVTELRVMHGNAPDADEFLEVITEVVPRERIQLGKIGPVIGTHGGPRVIGVTYLVAG